MAQAPPTQAPAVRLHGATAQAPPPAQTVRLRGVGKAIASFDLAILTRWTREASYVAMAWLVLIALNLVTTGNLFDVAVRDVEMAIAAYTLARLTEARESAVESHAPASHVAPMGVSA